MERGGQKKRWGEARARGFDFIAWIDRAMRETRGERLTIEVLFIWLSDQQGLTASDLDEIASSHVSMPPHEGQPNSGFQLILAMDGLLQASRTDCGLQQGRFKPGSKQRRLQLHWLEENQLDLRGRNSRRHQGGLGQAPGLTP